MNIVVLDGYTLNPGDNPWDAVASLGTLKVYDRTPPEEIVRRAQPAEILLTNKTPISAETIEQLPNLKFIAVLATGYNIVDTKKARERGIPVSNVPIYGTDSVAQFVFALLLEMIHNVTAHDHAVRDGAWARSGEFSFWNKTLFELAGKRMGIVGFGRIGRRVGDLAHAFGMEVWAADFFTNNPPSYSPFAFKSINEVFAGCDVISLHCPLTDENTGMVNRALIGTMKQSALLINTARGPLVNEADLAEALNSGRIAGAALDVVTKEPILESNPMLKAKNCILTPHIAWATIEGRRRLMSITAENVAAYLAGKPVNVVN